MDTYPMNENQASLPTLFPSERSPEEGIEHSPEVWSWVEDLASPDEGHRHRALSELVSMDAHRRSPLVAYVLATRLMDPNLEIRFHVVQALGEVLQLRDGDDLTPKEVRHHLQGYVSHMRKRQIFSLLQVAEQFGAAEDSVAAILNLCSYAGVALSEILNERKAPLAIRQKAIYFSGQVGFLDAIPALERLVHRLQSGHERQTHMDFVSSPVVDQEGDLLIYAQAALEKIRAKT